jgi:hypothetical protein
MTAISSLPGMTAAAICLTGLFQATGWMRSSSTSLAVQARSCITTGWDQLLPKATRLVLW